MVWLGHPGVPTRAGRLDSYSEYPEFVWIFFRPIYFGADTLHPSVVCVYSQELPPLCFRFCYTRQNLYHGFSRLSPYRQ